MAPGPHHRQEPVAPDKSPSENRVEHHQVVSDNTGNAGANTVIVATPTTTITTTATATTATATATAIVNDIVNDTSNVKTTSAGAGESSTQVNACSDKQEEPATLSTLNEGELRALLDEAITYKRPKDREGKSNLFIELLQEVEADETEEGRRAVTSARCLPGSNRRRHKRDSVSERLTHGGSLQNLAQPLNSEFDSSFAYLTSGSSHTYGGSRRKGKRHSGPSVSARQREGGSLPSNVNASYSFASLANLDLVFDKKKGFSEERTTSTCDWTNKEKSKSLDKPTYGGSKKEEKEKDRKESKRETSNNTIDIENITDIREKRCSRGKTSTNEMLESDTSISENKPEYMVIDLSDIEVGGIGDRNVPVTAGVQRPRSLDAEDEEGTEMKIIDPRRSVNQFITHATFDITQTPVDTTIDFPLREHNLKQDKSKIAMNGTTELGSGSLPFQPFDAVKCVVSGIPNSSSVQQGKGSSISVMPVFPSSNIDAMGRFATSQFTMKDTGACVEKRSFDENGNAVQSYNGKRKPDRRKHKQEHNVIVYKAEKVEGHREESDIDTLLNFIESAEPKGKKGKTGGGSSGGSAVRVKTSSGAKPKTREKDVKREQLSAKLHKSNSLEEISKTKLEDLTAEKSVSSSGASSISSQHGPVAINMSLRRAKQRSTGDAATVDCRGDRRSWGTEEEPEPEPVPEPEFRVVTKKKKSKKQRRSSSGSRTHNLPNSRSYLQRSRGFHNEYRTPISPELRRKSASSMPPSDKSDSSDLDSVHSLPVTSNTLKDNTTRNTTSSGNTPQASYADIARMAGINAASGNTVLMSTIVPNVLNPSSWPRVPSKTTSEPDKLPQDYYPSLDELQHSADRRNGRQNSFAHNNHSSHSFNLNFEKPPSPTLPKERSLACSKIDSAQEEAINKNIRVMKFVEDIEKMHQSISKERPEGKQHNTTRNSSPNSNELTNANVCDNNSDTCQIQQLEKDSNSNPTNTNCNNNNSSNNNNNNNTHNHPKGSRRGHNQNSEESTETTSLPSQEDVSSKNNCDLETTQKTTCRLTNNTESSITTTTKVDSKTERLTRALKDQQQNNNKRDSLPKVQNIVSKPEEETKTLKSSRTSRQKILDAAPSPFSISASKRNNASKERPAVILLDETNCDPLRTSEESLSELSFGFDINEELLLAEEAEEKVVLASATASTTTTTTGTSTISTTRYSGKQQIDRNVFDKHNTRLEKQQLPLQKFHIYAATHATPPPHTQLHQHVHHHRVMVNAIPYGGYSPRFPQTNYLHAPPPPPPPLPPPPPPMPEIIVDKYLHRTHNAKGDFSALYVEPEDIVNVRTYNHDKIVTFVGSAWHDVMREMPVTATANRGRVQYYSGQ